MKAGFRKHPAVAIIGGGWAGCAAALTLAEAGVTGHPAGSEPHPGRTCARQSNWKGATRQRSTILLGAYEQTLQLIERLHVTPGCGDCRSASTSRRISASPVHACPRRCICWRDLLSAQGLGWREKLAAARWAHTLLRGGRYAGPSDCRRTHPHPARKTQPPAVASAVYPR